MPELFFRGIKKSKNVKSYIKRRQIMENSKNFPTTKEVTLIADLLLAEEILFKKAKVNSKITMNEKLKNSFEILAEHHKQRFLSLYSLL